jgi:hypothetical protein
LAIGPTDLLVAVGQSASLVRVPWSGGPPEVLASGLGNTTGVARVGDDVYWSSIDTANVTGLHAQRTPRRCGGPLPPTPFVLAAGIDQPTGLAVAGDRLVVTSFREGRVLALPVPGTGVAAAR